MSADADARVAAGLLAYLSNALGKADLAYAAEPSRITGGLDAAIFGFALDRAPEHLREPLILRLGKEGANPRRFVLEAVVQNALSSLGFPAPRAHLTEADAAVLGGPFMVMQRLDGRPLAHDVKGLADGASLAEKVRGMIGLPALFRQISATWADIQLRLHELPAEPVLRAVADSGLDQRVVTFEGQLATLTAAIETANFNALTPVLAWLQANQPATRARATICHGDFHPLNIMADAGRVTGVIDWANVVVARPEMDVGSAIANISTVPINVPAPLRPVLRRVIASALGSYVRAYRSKRPLDDGALMYFQVFRAFAQLGWAVLARHAGRDHSGAFASEAGKQSLADFIASRSGVRVKL